jgi:hypothetical protein
MADDWRLTVDFDDEGDGTQLAEWLAAVQLEGEERSQLGAGVVVSRDGPRVFLYADTEERARAVLETVTARLRSEVRRARIALERWHSVALEWEDASVPLPASDEETRAEHERLQQREAAESLEKGRAEWEVRIELSDHEQTLALAERLESEGVPIVRRHTFLLAGALNEDDARALASRLEREAPEGARIEVEPGGGLVWEVAPQNPFVVFGGLGT